MRIVECSIMEDFDCLSLEDTTRGGSIELTEEEAAQLKQYFFPNHRYNFYKPGIWLAQKDKDEDLTYMKATFIAEVQEPIHPYPFVNVEKYRNDIEQALVKAFMESNTISAESTATYIINAISKRILKDKENHTLTKEDFYE